MDYGEMTCYRFLAGRVGSMNDYSAADAELTLGFVPKILEYSSFDWETDSEALDVLQLSFEEAVFFDEGGRISGIII
jgi:hypothetical protein